MRNWKQSMMLTALAGLFLCTADAKTDIASDPSLKSFVKDYIAALYVQKQEERVAAHKRLIHPKCLAKMETKKYALYFQNELAEDKEGMNNAADSSSFYQFDFLNSKGAQEIWAVKPTQCLCITAGRISWARTINVTKEGGKWWQVYEFPSNEELKMKGY